MDVADGYTDLDTLSEICVEKYISYIFWVFWFWGKNKTEHKPRLRKRRMKWECFQRKTEKRKRRM